MNAKQLKDSILQYAIQGKLVLQDPNDESAIELIKRIKAEKESMIARKVIKKEKALPEIKEEEIPFEIPDSWTWVKLADISTYIQRGKSPEYSEVDEIPVVSQKCVQWSGFNIEAAKFIEPSSIDNYDEIRLLQDNDLLWNSTGLGTVGRIGRYNAKEVQYEKVVVDTHVTIIRLSSWINSEYIYYYLASPTIQEAIPDMCSGSTKQKELNLSTIKNVVVPLPPINEQLRIVDKLVELEGKIEKYGEVFLDLTMKKEKFPIQLEKSILQYAMQGKLVEQVNTDEPASLLVKRIKAEKERLVKEKVIKKEKTLPEITEDEIPFEIPGTWEWVRVKDVCLVNPKNNASDDMDAAFIPMKLIDDGFVNEHDFEIRKWGDIKKGFTHFQSGDVVVAKITPCFENRKSAVLLDLPNDFGAGTTELYVIRPIENMIYNEFLLWLFKTHHFISNGVATYTGTAGQQRVSKLFIENYLIPLPPYEEQLRIVEAIKKMNIQIESISEG